MNGLTNYYSQRAGEYEEIYNRDDPVRQQELEDLGLAMKRVMDKRKILEIACGTGYWTRILAEIAQHVTAIDTSLEMIAVAKESLMSQKKVEFLSADAYRLDLVPGDFDAGVANFWFSHVPKTHIGKFVDGMCRRLGSGSVIFMADNIYIAGIGGELISKPGTEDTYKIRKLADGSKHEVLKNYYDRAQLDQIFRTRTNDLQINICRCFWWLCGRID